jgi:hypothetical protein
MYLPTGSDSVSVQSHLNSQYAIIDKFAGAYCCTSTTRPTGANLKDGMIIYERDTQCLRVWVASITNWNYLTGSDRARGLMGDISSNAASATIGAGVEAPSTSYMKVSFVERANRTYALRYSVRVAQVTTLTDPTGFTLRFRKNYNASNVDTSSPELVTQPFDLKGNTIAPQLLNGTYTWTAPNTDRAVTVGMFIHNTSGSGATCRIDPATNSMMIEDIGTFRVIGKS